ncbi:isochorismatase family cysteine hydrolase [Pseudohoeflea coraliihabitans]|uniref:Cysteine hydrolase n=1 Tax=Pseudohoeflea coraliihabitans TaxID=2860393 RepID=A0ABS6WMQ2_9HYPH|nr:isochorismatase family cysteine hydrolase [Pseudohoeflea sp. DP4N28-3]MBW3097252.1 cysteine hydrolase [Pseudohoeflea sp. DP4N28-3]
MTKVWDAFVSERDRRIFRAAGYGVQGEKPARPALLLIGFEQRHLEGPDAVAGAREAGEKARRLMVQCRAKGLPVIHVAGPTPSDGHPGPHENGEATSPVGGSDFAANMMPEPRDIVLRRHAPSAFFDSDLMSFLNLLGADGLILAGGQTAGALRATAIDAFSLNLRVVIADDACFDMWQASHAIALCDLDAKYADPASVEMLAEWIETLPANAFALPAGERVKP